MTIRSKIIATGSYLPDQVMSNADLEKIVDTTDEWIYQRSGIKNRHIAAKTQTTSDMAIEAAKRAIEISDIKVADIDYIVVATTTPDLTFPSVAVTVQAALGIPVCPAFDVQAVCSGFVYALSVADNAMKTGQAKRALVIGAEKMSSILDWTDRTTCVLFGDGAGAVILEADEDAAGTFDDTGIISTHLYANGHYKDILKTSGGPSTTKNSGFIEMEGKEVFRYAVQFLSEVVVDVLKAHNVQADVIDWLVPHQANIRIIMAAAKKLNLPESRVILTLENHGNTSAASIPLALDHAVRNKTIKPGDLMMLEALGGGLTWGAALVRL